MGEVTKKEVEAILARVMFKASCVDMGWLWEVKEVADCEGSRYYGACGDDWNDAGFLIRTTFQRPDRDTGAVSLGFGRYWHIPPNASESAIVKTAFAAAKLILEHELMEAFHFDGVRIFDPHHDVDDLKNANFIHANMRKSA